jgi:two-component system sensor kinase
VRHGSSRLVVVETESGGGKTRLLDELAQRAHREGLWVMRGTGANEIAQRPYQMLDGVVRDIIAAARAQPDLGPRLLDQLGDLWAAVAAALPRLAEALGGNTSANLGPEAFGEARTIQAIARLLDLLGSPEHPALIILDDCQWADDVAEKLITHWTDEFDRRGSGRALMVVVAYRSEEVLPEHPLRRLAPNAHLKLDRFGPEDTRRLIESMAGQLPDEIVKVVTTLSGGSPFMASAVLRGLVESGALVADGDRWRVEQHALESLQSSHRLALARGSRPAHGRRDSRQGIRSSDSERSDEVRPARGLGSNRPGARPSPGLDAHRRVAVRVRTRQDPRHAARAIAGR